MQWNAMQWECDLHLIFSPIKVYQGSFMPSVHHLLGQATTHYEFLAFSKLIGFQQRKEGRKVGWLAHQPSKSHVDFVPIWIKWSKTSSSTLQRV